MEYENILKRLKALSNPKTVEGMAWLGINPENTYGVSIPNLRRMAKEMERITLLLNGFGSHESTKRECLRV